MESLLASAGFQEPTPLQKKYVPAALQGKDLIVECRSGDGKTLAQMIPFVLHSRPTRRNTIILVHSHEGVGKYEREFQRITGVKTKTKHAAFLGRDSLAKNELSILSRRPGLIVGTSERLIDHIRRNNLRLSQDTTVVINVPEEEEEGRAQDFFYDVEFIMTKAPHKSQTVVFSPSIEKAQPLTPLLKRPHVISTSAPHRELPVLHVYTSPMRSRQHLEQLILGLGLHSPLVLSSPEARNTELRQLEKSFTVHAFGHPVAVQDDFDSIILYGLPGTPEVLSKALKSSKHFLAALISEQEAENLNTLQESIQMKAEHQAFPQNEEILKGKLQSIVDHIKHEEDPEILNRYKKIIKKSVPFHMRAYLSAYLFKISMEDRRQKTLAPEHQTLFISVGKNRKVFPRDLIRLFKKHLEMKSGDIGNIKVLDNYSFVDIPKDLAPKAIEKMDGIEFRGRNITVNFARKKN